MSQTSLRDGIRRWGWLLPLLTALLIIGATVYLERQVSRELESSRRAAAAEAEGEAASLAEHISAEMASRIGALAAAQLQFTQVEDSLSHDTFLSAVDSVISRLPGLRTVSVIYPSGELVASRSSVLALEDEPLEHPAIEDAYARALAGRRPATTPLVHLAGRRRFLVFDPIAASDTGSVRAVVVAEMEPLAILAAALERGEYALSPAFYDLYDPEGTRITAVPAPEGWPSVQRSIQVADQEWSLYLAYQPVNERSYVVTAAAIRTAGILLALAFAAALFALWRMVHRQQREIELRRTAEKRARDLNEQLEAAQEMALRLSGSRDPDQLMDDFLGAAGSEIGADVGRLYVFDEAGEVLEGRRLVVLNPALQEEFDEAQFQRVRTPAALLDHLAEPVATGQPYIATGRGARGGGGPAEPNAPAVTLSVPLTISGHLIGVAVWESYFDADLFDEEMVPFLQSVAAHAAAALRAAELVERIREARKRATKEAVRLATVLEQLGDGVILFDAAGQPERVNPAAEAVMGTELADAPLEEWPTRFRIVEARPGGNGFAPARALQGEVVRDARFTLREGGIERYIALSAAPIRGSDDAIRGAALVLRDVTAEHEYAEMLRHTNEELRHQAHLLERANEEMRAATMAKDQFLAMMSHELRTPINAIVGYTDILALGIHGVLNEKQQHSLERIAETSRHLLGLIEDVLDLAKIGAGRISLSLEEIDLEGAMERAAAQILPLANAKGLDVRRESGAGITVVADDLRLLQILINLCSNAVKFTEHGSITIGVAVEKEFARIAVRDTGPGIPPDQLETVFEEFHQVESGFARKAGGTGLGLTISRKLARMMGGEITVTSEVGEGTEFNLFIPIATEETAGVGSERARRTRSE